jgi:membrane protein YdbS with pleckstrin-like domain
MIVSSFPDVGNALNIGRPHIGSVPISYLWFIVPIPFCLAKILTIACWSYEIPIEGEYVIETKGVLSRTRVEVHCFRIKSIEIVKPNLLFMIFGLSNVVVKTSEPFKPVLTYYAISDATIPNCDGINDYLRDSSIYWRNVKGVKETDFHGF